MTRILSICSNDINADIYSYMDLLNHRRETKYFFSDGTIGEIKNKLEEPKLKGDKAVGCCGIENINYICYIGFTIVYDGIIDVKYFKNVSNPLVSIQRLIDLSNDNFFGIYISDREIYAFKDRTGSLPGMFGIGENRNIVICSENIGFIKTDDIFGGEILHIKDKIITRNVNIRNVKPNIYEFLFYAKSESDIYGLNVGEFRHDLSSLLVNKLDKHFDAIFSISEESRIYGLTIANILKIPYMEPKKISNDKFISKINMYKFEDNHFSYDNILVIDKNITTDEIPDLFIKSLKCKNKNDITFLSLLPNKEMVELGYDIIYNTDENLKNISGFQEISY